METTVNIFKRLLINLEAAKFGYKFGKELVSAYPLITSREIEIRTTIAWCEHLENTNRAHLIKDKSTLQRMRTAINTVDRQPTPMLFN